MKSKLLVPAILAGVAGLLISGCITPPPGVERGPNGTVAYDVLIESSPPGAKIEANGEVIGDAPLHLKIYGDLDGTFHDFGSDYYIIRALPIATNQFVQTQVFRTGRYFTPEDKIPPTIGFDMKTPPPPYPVAGPAYAYPPPAYYYPPGYYGPRVQFYFGPGYYHYHHW